MGHDIRSLKMPKGGPKLSPDVIQDFERWISTGAYDPRGTLLRQKNLQMKPLGKKLGRKGNLGGVFNLFGKITLLLPPLKTIPIP